MADHRQEALSHAQRAVDLVNSEQRDWVEQGKVHAALAQTEALLYVGDQAAALVEFFQGAKR